MFLWVTVNRGLNMFFFSCVVLFWHSCRRASLKTLFWTFDIVSLATCVARSSRVCRARIRCYFRSRPGWRYTTSDSSCSSVWQLLFGYLQIARKCSRLTHFAADKILPLYCRSSAVVLAVRSFFFFLLFVLLSAEKSEKKQSKAQERKTASCPRGAPTAYLRRVHHTVSGNPSCKRRLCRLFR